MTLLDVTPNKIIIARVCGTAGGNTPNLPTTFTPNRHEHPSFHLFCRHRLRLVGLLLPLNENPKHKPAPKTPDKTATAQDAETQGSGSAKKKGKGKGTSGPG